jgi:hypothetical protein
MGIPYYDFEPGRLGPPLSAEAVATSLALEVETGDMVYLVCRREDYACPNCGIAAGRYHIQGAFTSAELAEAAAEDETYFVGPLPLNMAFPRHIFEWPGLYWPHHRKGQPDAAAPVVASTEPAE